MNSITRGHLFKNQFLLKIIFVKVKTSGEKYKRENYINTQLPQVMYLDQRLRCKYVMVTFA